MSVSIVLAVCGLVDCGFRRMFSVFKKTSVDMFMKSAKDVHLSVFIIAMISNYFKYVLYELFLKV